MNNEICFENFYEAKYAVEIAWKLCDNMHYYKAFLKQLNEQATGPIFCIIETSLRNVFLHTKQVIKP